MGSFSALLGIYLSYYLDLASRAAIILVATALFFLTLALTGLGESCIPGGALQGLGHPPPGAPSRGGLHHYWVVPTLPNATKKHLHRTSYSRDGSSFTLEYRPVSCNLRVPSLQTTDR